MRIDLYEQGGYSGGGITENGGNISGPLILAGNPSQTLEAVPKQYVDAYFYSLNANNIIAGTINPARLPAFTGDILKAEGTNTFNLANSGVTPGSYGRITVNAKGIVTGGSSLNDNDIPFGIDWSKINSGSLPNTLSGYGIVDGVAATGGTLTGFLSLNQAPTQGAHAVNKQYIDGLVSGGGISVGDIIRKPYSGTPSGFLKCNGAEVDKTTYASLYSVIGDSFNNNTVSGNGSPWQQQYQINNHTGDLSPWVTDASTLYTSIYYSSVVVTKNRVYLLGGWNGAYTNAVYTAIINADGTLGTWTIGTALPQVQSLTYVFVTKNRVYMCGGYVDNSVLTTAVYTATINSDGTLGSWVAGPSLPSVLGQGVCFVTKNRVYIIGGSNGVGPQNTVFTATINSDGTVTSWVTSIAFPVTISNCTCFVTKNRVYIAGGYQAGAYSNAVYTAPINSDGTLGTWVQNTRHLPEALTTSSYFCTKNTAYVIGGTNSGISSRVYFAPINADGTLGEWAASPNLIPIQMWAGRCFVTKNKVYVTAGQVGGAGSLSNAVISATLGGGLNDYSSYYSEDTTNYLMPGSGKPWQQQYQINNTQSADITGWTTTTSLPGAITYSSSIVTKNRVYVLGSYSGSAVVYTAPINADGTLGTWTTGTSLPIGLSAAQAIVTKNRVYLLGGYSNSTVYTAPINADGTLGTWSNAGIQVPNILAHSQAIITKNRVYLLGGETLTNVYISTINSDGTLNAWTTGISLPTSISGSQAVVTKNRVYLIGGYNGGYLSTIYTATINSDGLIGPWSTAGNYPIPVAYSQAIITKNRVYLLGGYNSTYYSTGFAFVYSAPIDSNGILGAWTQGTSLPGAIIGSTVIMTKNRIYMLGGANGYGSYYPTVYTASILEGLNDYSPYYDGTIVANELPDNSTKFLLPDFSADEPFGSYSYIKY